MGERFAAVRLVVSRSSETRPAAVSEPPSYRLVRATRPLACSEVPSSLAEDSREQCLAADLARLACRKAPSRLRETDSDGQGEAPVRRGAAAELVGAHAVPPAPVHLSAALKVQRKLDHTALPRADRVVAAPVRSSSEKGQGLREGSRDHVAAARQRPLR